MIKQFLQQAAEGRCVFITDVREAFQTGGARPFHLHVTLYDRSIRVFPLLLPETAGEDEKQFAAEYVYASVYNLLSALGGRRVDIYLDRTDREAAELADRMASLFRDESGGGLYRTAAEGERLIVRQKDAFDAGIPSGAGAAGIAIIRLLMSMGLKNVVMTDRQGAIYQGREGLNPIKEEMAAITNFAKEEGTLAEVIRGADVFIGVSAPGTLTADMVRSMAKDPIIFACANPTPEIFPEEAKAAGAAVVSTGRSDYPNQVNNVLCFPGIFRGALDVRASDINDQMKVAAAYALAGLVSDEELNADYILPKAFDPRVKDAVAKATAEAARASGVARL